jgi:hypothetical protein
MTTAQEPTNGTGIVVVIWGKGVHLNTARRIVVTENAQCAFSALLFMK